jgi:hypothetical protein
MLRNARTGFIPHIFMTEVIRVKQITPGGIVHLFFCVIDLNASKTAYKASFGFRKIYGVLRSGFPKKARLGSAQAI